MNRLRLLGGVLMMLLLVACSKDELSREVFDEREYVRIDLSVVADEDESARAVYHTSGGNIKFSFNNTAGNATTRVVHTTVFDGANNVFEADLNWKIERNGTRLSYNGPLFIHRSKLTADRTKLTLTAIVGNRDLKQAYVISELTEGVTSPKEIEVPYIMKAKLKEVATQKLVLENPTRDAKFKPEGVFLRLTIQNNMPVPTIATGLRIIGATHSNVITDEKGNLSFTNSDTEYAYWFEVHNRDHNVGGRVNVGTSRNPIRFNIGGVIVKPGGAKNANTLLVWLPLLSAQSIKSVYTTGPAYTQAVRTGNQPAQSGSIVDYKAIVEPGGISQTPGGIYVSREGYAQYWIDVDQEKLYFAEDEIDQQLSKYQKVYPSAYLGSLSQWFMYSYGGHSAGDVELFPESALNPRYVDTKVLGYYVQFYKDAVHYSYISDYVRAGGVSYDIMYYSAVLNRYNQETYDNAYQVRARPFLRKVEYIKYGEDGKNPSAVKVSFLPYDKPLHESLKLDNNVHNTHADRGKQYALDKIQILEKHWVQNAINVKSIYFSAIGSTIAGGGRSVFLWTSPRADSYSSDKASNVYFTEREPFVIGQYIGYRSPQSVVRTPLLFFTRTDNPRPF